MALPHRYEVAGGQLGQPWHRQQYPFPAPALLGFDESIEDFCNDELRQMGKWIGRGHAQDCVEAGVNILALYGDRVPYNICRNLEWVVCAAQGALPGQSNTDIIFAKARSNTYTHARAIRLRINHPARTRGG